MKSPNRKLRIAAAFAATFLVVWLAFTYTSVFWWSCFALFVLAIGAVYAYDSFQNSRFCVERAAAMNAIEDLAKTIDFIDKELPLDRYRRFQFQLAVDHAFMYADCLKERIYALQRFQLDRCLPRDGLQLKDMPTRLLAVTDEVRDAYNYIKNGSTGPSPDILRLDWFDEATILSGTLRRTFQPTQLHSVPRRSVSAPIPQEIQMDQLLPQPEISAPVTASVPANQRLLTYAPQSEEHVVCSAPQLESRRRALPARTRDVVVHEVVEIDFKARKRIGK